MELHVFHHPTIPGTRLNRIAFTRPLIDEVFSEVSSWEGYKFRAGKYGQRPFTKVLDPSAADFEDNLEAEVIRICQTFGPPIDKALQRMLERNY